MTSGRYDGTRPASGRARASEPQPISEILPGLVARLGGDRRPGAWMTEVVNHWEEVAGAEMAAHVRAGVAGPAKVVLEADSPEWAAMARYSATALLERLGHGRGPEPAGAIEIVVRVRRPGTSLW